jgi:flagellar assembly protein FliH
MTSIIRTPPVATLRRHLALGGPSATDSASAAGPSALQPVDPLASTQNVHPPMHAPILPLQTDPEQREPVDAETPAETRERGFRAGYDEGFQAGHAEGLERGMVDGRQLGFAQGLKEGATHAHDEIDRREQRCDTLMAAVGQACERIESLMEDDAVEAVFAAVLQVAGQAHADREGLRSLYRAALAQVRDRRHLQLHVHPEDLAFLREEGMPDSALVPGAAAIEFVADGDIELGGCRVQGHGGELDARLERQLGALRDALRTIRAQRAGDQP